VSTSLGLLAISAVAAALVAAARRSHAGPVLASVLGTALGAGLVSVAVLSAAADPLSRVALLGCGVVSVVAFAGGYSYYQHQVREDHYSNTDASLVGSVSLLFVGLLGAAAMSDDVLMAWAFIEGTTIVGAYLVAIGRHAHSAEAAWKFSVLCFLGVGTGLAGLGILEALVAETASTGSLTFDSLGAVSASLPVVPAAAGLALLFVGFGTKAGVFPFHWWLPDAHSQTPTPVSALMSGALVPTALVLLARAWLAMPDAAGRLRPVLIGAALLGLLVATLAMAGQGDAKRLLAYSTVEHMALMLVAVAIGNGLALVAFSLHLLGHAVAKSGAFMGIGSLVESFGSRRIDRISGSTASTPLVSSLVIASGASLIGFPLGPIFVAEILLLIAAANAGLSWLAAALAVLLVLAGAAFGERVVRIVTGPSRAVTVTLGRSVALVPLAAVALSTVVLLARPAALSALIAAVASLAAGGLG